MKSTQAEAQRIVFMEGGVQYTQALVDRVAAALEARDKAVLVAAAEGNYQGRKMALLLVLDALKVPEEAPRTGRSSPGFYETEAFKEHFHGGNGPDWTCRRHGFPKLADGEAGLCPSCVMYAANALIRSMGPA